MTRPIICPEHAAPAGSCVFRAIRHGYLLTGGVAGVVVAGLALAFFTFFFFETLEAFAGAEASLPAGAGVVVAGAVWAKDIAASARVIEKTVMVFIVFVSFSFEALCSYCLCLLRRGA